jgi:hypothetical protein
MITMWSLAVVAAASSAWPGLVKKRLPKLRTRS